jgi:hypothetical protein
MKTVKKLRDMRAAQEDARKSTAKLLSRKRSLRAEEPVPATKETVASTAPEPDTVPEPLPVATRSGQAQIPVYQDDESQPGKVPAALRSLVDLYLHAAAHRTRHIVLMWPASIRSVALVHALACLERWQERDKQGVRGLVYPVKSNVFFPLDDVRLDREALLRYVNEVREFDQKPGLVRSMPEKDAYLFSLGSLRPDAAERFNPTAGELLPRFFAAPGFKAWNSCADKLLSQISAKLKRRAQARALETNCAVIGDPKRAPDALFAIDGRIEEAELRRALMRLASDGPPEVVLVIATRNVRSEGRTWKNRLADFCLRLESTFAAKPPGVIVLTDETFAAFALKDQLWELNNKRHSSLRWRSPHEYAIRGIPCLQRVDELLASEEMERVHPMPRVFDVHVVDAEASKTIEKLYRVAKEAPGGREGAKPVMEAATYISRLAALPCGVKHLVEYLSGAEVSNRVRAAFDWMAYGAALREFDRSGAVPQGSKQIHECIIEGTDLFAKYEQATPFAHRLAATIAEIATKKRERVALVFTSAFNRRLAERFLETYGQYPNGLKFDDFRNRVHLLVAAQLEENLQQLAGTRLVFAGLNEECLRLVLSDDRVPAHSVLLLTYRTGRFLRASLEPIVEKFPEFRSFKPRIESILKPLQGFPKDASVLQTGDFVLPAFRPELSTDSSAGVDRSDPDAWFIRLDAGATIYRRDTHKVFLYDPTSQDSSEKGFRSCEVKSLQIGDKLFVMSAELREMVEDVLREAGIPIQSDTTFEAALRMYHAQVTKKLAERFPAKNRSEQVRALRRAMIEINPRLENELPMDSAMRAWIDLGESTTKAFEDLRPQAPLREANFDAFAKALGFSPLEAAYQWQRVIMAVRTSRRLDGRHISDIYTYMLLNPESMMVHANIKRQTLKALFERARDAVATVEDVGPCREKVDDQHARATR